MTTSIEDLFKIVAWLGIPIIGGVVALVSTLWSIKSDLRRIEATITGKYDNLEDRLDKLERVVHRANTDILALRIELAQGVRHEQR